MADTRRSALGRVAERRALDFLKDRGLTLVTSNFRTRHGEIDLVMRDGRCLVFVEVRYRGTGAVASAAQSVDARKQRKIVLAALGFARRYPGLGDDTMRFDVVAIDRRRDGTERIEWLADAFRAEA